MSFLSLRFIIPVFLIGMAYVGVNWLFLTPPEPQVRGAANQDPDTADVTLKEVKFGPITVHDIAAVVTG